MSISQPKPAWVDSYVTAISNLRKSPSTMNPPIPLSQDEKTYGPEAKIYKFICENYTWSIDSLYAYCRDMYTPVGFNNQIFSECIKRYIDTKFSI